MLKILRTTLRQPCGLAKRKMVLRLPQEIPQKCVRRQVHGCRRADVKRALTSDQRSVSLNVGDAIGRSCGQKVLNRYNLPTKQIKCVCTSLCVCLRNFLRV